MTYWPTVSSAGRIRLSAAMCGEFVHLAHTPNQSTALEISAADYTRNFPRDGGDVSPPLVKVVETVTTTSRSSLKFLQARLWQQSWLFISEKSDSWISCRVQILQSAAITFAAKLRPCHQQVRNTDKLETPSYCGFYLARLFQATHFDFIQMPSSSHSFSIVTDPQLLYVVSDVLQLK